MEGSREAVFLQLLVSHICHELVSPVGAIGNGVELLEEMGTLDRDAVDLIALSSRTAAAKLRLLRVTYGSAGLSSDFRLPEAQKALHELFSIENKILLDWRPSGPLDLAPGAVQLATALVLLTPAALPRGGSVGVTVTPEQGGVLFRTTATGTGVRLTEEIRQAVAGEGAPDHKTIHAHFCAWAAARLGTRVSATAAADAVGFTALLPSHGEG